MKGRSFTRAFPSNVEVRWSCSGYNVPVGGIVTSPRRTLPDYGAIHGMKATIDASGRVVIPKKIREAAALEPGTELEVRLVDGHIELEPGYLPVRLVRKGRFLVAVPEVEVGPLTLEEVEQTREAIWRERAVAAGAPISD
jgi:AbrB family looped-hinge helix DNA binding protein